MSNVQMRGLEVIISEPAKDGFSASINVVAEDAVKVPLDETRIRNMLVKAISDKYSKLGMKPANIKSKPAKFRDRSAMSIYFEYENAAGMVLKCWQVMISGTSRLYVISSTAKAGDFDRFQPVFRGAIQSMKIDTDDVGAVSRILDAAAGGVIIGAAFSVLAGLLILVRHPRGKPKRSGNPVQAAVTTPPPPPPLPSQQSPSFAVRAGVCVLTCLGLWVVMVVGGAVLWGESTSTLSARSMLSLSTMAAFVLLYWRQKQFLRSINWTFGYAGVQLAYGMLVEKVFVIVKSGKLTDNSAATWALVIGFLWTVAPLVPLAFMWRRLFKVDPT